MNDHTKPSATLWITVALVVALVGYPLSYGPWYGMVQHRLMTEQVRLATAPVYVPVEWIINNSSGYAREAIFRYLSLWAP